MPAAELNLLWKLIKQAGRAKLKVVMGSRHFGFFENY